MAIDLDDEILQDFLVEAGEILELLSEQLVDLGLDAPIRRSDALLLLVQLSGQIRTGLQGTKLL